MSKIITNNNLITTCVQTPSQAPSRTVKAVTDKILKNNGISSEIEHRDPGFFKTRIWTLFPPLQEICGAESFSFPDLDSLLEAHLIKRHGKEAWEGYSPEKKLEYKRGLAGSARNWDDLIYQVVLENIDDIPGLTEAQKERLKNPPLIREEFRHNSPLNGQSYLDAEGNPVKITHAGSCTEDRESETTHLLRRISYNKTKETLYYTGRPETTEKAVEQGSWMFLKELDVGGKGITKNEDGTYTFNYVVDSLLDSTPLASKAKADKTGSVLDKLKEERVTLRNLRNSKEPIEVKGSDGKIHRVHLKPILFHQQYNAVAEAEKIFPAWISGKSLSDEIVKEALPELSILAKNGLDSLKAQYQKASHTEQPEILKKITYLSQAIQKLDNYENLTRRERIFYLVLLCRMLNIPMVVHCKSSKDRTGGVGKLICALYTWLDAGMPDDFSKIVGKRSAKDGNTLRNLFDELITGHLMAAHQVTGYALGAKGEIEGEKLDAERRGLDIGEAPPIVSRLPERYTTERTTAFIAGWYALATFLWLVTVITELAAIGAMITEALLESAIIVLGTVTGLLFVYKQVKGNYFPSWFFHITRNVGPTILTDLLIRPLYLFRYPKRILDKKSPYVTGHSLPKPKGRTLAMSEKGRKALQAIESLPEDTYTTILNYLKQNNGFNTKTSYPDQLIELGRAMPVLSSIVKRKDFTITPKARLFIETFEKSEKSTLDKLEYLPEHEFEHLCAFMEAEDTYPETVLSPRELVLFRYFSDLSNSKDLETERGRAISKILQNSNIGKLSSQKGVDALPNDVYQAIIEYLKNPKGNLSELTRNQQKLLLIILTNLHNIQPKTDRSTEIIIYFTRAKIASTLLQQIDQLSEDEYQKLQANLENPPISFPFIQKIMVELLQKHFGTISSLNKSLNVRQKAILEGIAILPSREKPFSLAHIEFLKEPQYNRLLTHFKSSNPQIEELSPSDQALLRFILVGANECFTEGTQATVLTKKETTFLNALAESPYGIFTYDRTLFLRKKPYELKKETQVALIRDIEFIRKEAVSKNIPEAHFLYNGNPDHISQMIVDQIYGWIDALSEKEYRHILNALKQPTPEQFTHSQKQLLLAIANHIECLEKPTPTNVKKHTSQRYPALLAACRQSPLFLFQFQKLMSMEAINSATAPLTQTETLSDLSINEFLNTRVMSLDGSRIYEIPGQLKVDLDRLTNIQLYVDDQLIPNPFHPLFIFSPQLIASERGIQFFNQMKEQLKRNGMSALYEPLKRALEVAPFHTILTLVDERELEAHQLSFLIEPLRELFKSNKSNQLKAILTDLQERLILDCLFDSLRKLPALFNMEQFPPTIISTFCQTARNYYADRISGQYLMPNLVNCPLSIVPGFGSTDIRFSSADDSSIHAHCEMDINCNTPASDNLRHGIHLMNLDCSYEYQLKKEINSIFWTSEFRIPTNPRFTFATLLPEDTDMLFKPFSCPEMNTLCPQEQIVSFLKTTISKMHAKLPLYPIEARPYYERRIQENLATLKGLIEEADYNAYFASLPQMRIKTIQQEIRSLNDEKIEIGEYEARMSDLLDSLKPLMPNEECEPIATQMKAAIELRRNAS